MVSSITQPGGYDYEFVDTNLPDEFQCPICRLVPRDVHQASCCGKMFCKSCLDTLRRTRTSNRYTCPNCRAKSQFFQDANMNRKIRNLQIHCTNKSKECLWEGSLQDVDNHLSTCFFQTVECSNKCGQQLMRKHLNDHLTKQCPERIVLCHYCKSKGEYRSITGIHFNQCPNVPLDCPNNGCKQKIKRNLMTQHRTECPHEMVMCSNECDIKLKRRELYDHLQDQCMRRKVTCVYCHTEDEYQIISGCHYDICRNFPLNCSNRGCEEITKRHLMTQHRAVCPHKIVMCSNGCGFELKRQLMTQHRAVCPHEMVMCSNQCSLKRHELSTHLHNCPKRIVFCPHCHRRGKHRSITGVHLTKCPNIPLLCPNNGCKEKIKRHLMTQHRDECLHEKVICPNECGFELKRRQLPNHLCNCPKRIVSCSHCQLRGEHKSITGVHLTKCPNVSLYCPNNECEEKIQQHLMTQHRDTCPKEEVVCQYSFMSYKCNKKMKREDIPQHNKEYMIQHYSNIIIPLGFMSLIIVLIMVSTPLRIPIILLTIYVILVGILARFGDTQE